MWAWGEVRACARPRCRCIARGVLCTVWAEWVHPRLGLHRANACPFGDTPGSLQDGGVRLWDLTKGAKVAENKELHTAAVTSTQFSLGTAPRRWPAWARCCDGSELLDGVCVVKPEPHMPECQNGLDVAMALLTHKPAGARRTSMILTASRDNTLGILDGCSLVPDTPPKLFRAEGFRLPYLWSRARFRCVCCVACGRRQRRLIHANCHLPQRSPPPLPRPASASRC